MITLYATPAEQTPEEVLNTVRRVVYFDDGDEQKMKLHLFFRRKADCARGTAWGQLVVAWLNSPRNIEEENPWHKLHTENYWVYYRRLTEQP